MTLLPESTNETLIEIIKAFIEYHDCVERCKKTLSCTIAEILELPREKS
jgi:hypothetical protein